jgi:peptidoglycan/LPS O-acetylase OafA/YrhL
LAIQSFPSCPIVADGDRIPGLDFLRAISVSMVLADHSGLYRIGGVAIFDGGLGVEIFFVLSGFLITGLLMDEFASQKTISLGRFYLRRASRLLPAFYAYVLVGAFLLAFQNKPMPWGAIVSSLLYTINYYQAAVGAPSNYLSHCWSLAVEEQFYFIWPIVVLALAKAGRLTIRSAVIAFAIAWFAKLILVIVIGATDEYLYRSLESRADQLLAGALLAVFSRSAYWQTTMRTIDRFRWIALALLVLLVLSINFFRGDVFSKYVLGYTIEPLLIALLIPCVILLASREGVLAKLLNSGASQIIGRVSYGMYLFHPFVMHGTKNFAMRAGVPSALSIAISFAAVTAVALASFYLFERPLQDWIRKRFNRAPKAA